MSKRSSRRKRKERRQKQETKLTGPVLAERGLAAFKQANYEEAITAWEQARRKGNTPANLPTALAEAYFRRAISSPGPNLGDLQQAVKLRPADPCYRYHLGLIYHRLGELDQAELIYRDLLVASPPFERAATPLAQLLIEKKKPLADDQTEQAFKQWQTAQANGLDTQHLRHNLGILTYHQLLAERQAGRPAQALDLLAQIHLPGAIGIDPYNLRQQMNWEVGYAAAQQGQWKQALDAWQTAEAMGDDSRKLLFNLALAYQKTEHHWEAAERWRELLRRRPRKADHPEALNDEQVTRIWQNVADNYSQVGDYEEAIKTYKNAVKWSPDNVDLRLKLVDALQAEGRWQAAENELNRILDKKPDYVPALIALAESYAEDYWGEHQARNLLLRVLELEPQNPIARQQLAFLFERRGVSILQWGQAHQALAIFEEGLELVPDNQRLLVLVGGVYVGTGEHDKGRPYFEKALTANPNDLQTLYTVYLAWLNAGSQADVDQTFERIKAIRGPIPGSFFIDLINRCLEAGQEKQAMTLIDYAEAHYQDDEPTLLMLASLLSDVEQEGRALALLRKILKESPDHAEANLQLGTLYFEMGQSRLAKRHWQKAEQQARKEKNQMLLYQLKMTRDTMLYGKQPPRNMFDMLRQMPPELRQQLFEGAPPEIAAMLQNMDLETLEMLMGFAMDDDMGSFDFFDDEDDDYYV